jgi:Fe-S-cluster containining protein
MALIAGMAIEVAAHEPADPGTTVRSGFLHEFDPARDDGKVHWYTCRNLTADGNCAIYATRPRMCSEYPYGKPCLYADCQCDAARTGAMGCNRMPLTLGDVDKIERYLDAPQDWR